MVTKNDIFFILKLKSGVSACIALPQHAYALHESIIDYLMDIGATLNKSYIEAFESYADKPNRYTAILSDWMEFEVLMNAWHKNKTLQVSN